MPLNDALLWVLIPTLLLASHTSAQPGLDEPPSTRLALEAADELHWDPIAGCLGDLAGSFLGGVVDKTLNKLLPVNIHLTNTAFLGPLNLLQTGDVLQAFYHVKQRTGCSSGGGNSSSSGHTAAGTHQPPLVLIPGLNAAMSVWGSSFLAALACSRELIVMENRGAGLSVDYSKEPLTYYTMAESVLQLTDALNLTKPDILGWSSGGDIGLILAALHGDRVGKVIGLGAMAGSNHTVLPDIPNLFDPEYFNSLSLAQDMALLFPPQRSDFKDLVCAYTAGVAAMPNGTVQVNDTVFQGQYLADVDFTTSDSTVWDRLPDIKNKVLLVDGDQDVSVPAINSQLIGAQIPGSTVVIYPGWGHCLLMGSVGKDLVTEINTFLDSSA